MISQREGARHCHRAWRRWCCAFLAGCFGLASIARCQSPLHTNSPRFRIPFQFDPREMERIGASEVQLHVSTDGGQTWMKAEAVAPEAGKFLFEAPGDGAFLFSVRTLDQEGQMHPTGPLEPSLHVIVDQEPPTLTVRIATLASGDIEAAWQADDDHLAVDTLRLEYLDATSGVWQPLPAAASPVGVVDVPRMSDGEVMVRGAISDLAGNSVTATASAIPNPQPTATPESGASQPDFREPVASGAEANGGPPLLTSISHGDGALPTILPNMPHAPVPAHPIFASRPVRMADVAAAPAANDAASSPGLLPGQDDNAFAGPPLMSHPVHRVNARTFRIAYQLQDVGPSGVGSVELYISEDNGARWFHYGADPDRQSPFEATVPRDGRYGFAIRVKNGMGAIADPPQPGQPPEIGIVVDQTAPITRLMPLQQSAVGGAIQVRIAWFLQDEQLADRPVSLSQSSSPNGPWEPITGWIENHGRYLWSVSTLAPRNIYVRLQARDAAGNVSVATSDHPLMIDTSRPSARVLDVESVERSGTIR